MSDPRNHTAMQKARDALAALASFERIEILRDDDDVRELIDAAQAVSNLPDVGDRSEEDLELLERLQGAADAFDDHKSYAW